MEDFHSSISFDQRLYRQDIAGSLAHAQMLADQGIISAAEGKLIRGGLLELLADIEAGRVEFDASAEDIHMNIEQLLTAKIGPAGKKLHTARSRNDQVAVDLRLFLKGEVAAIDGLLRELLSTLFALAEQHLGTVMPGYTHVQRAQPVTLAHHLMAYAAMFGRDVDRLKDTARRIDVCPLGAGALAGTTFATDPLSVAAQLGFSQVALNSMDAVSDRDFVIEFCATAATIMMHLSRFSEEIVLWSSAEYGFIELSDAYSTGSSIMPQKKNPDAAELVRGKTGRVYGDLMAVLTQMKGLPLAYNKDMQEDKEALFDAVDTVRGCLMVFTPMLNTMKVNKARMSEAARGGYTNATDLADYLATRGVPFRDAHEVVGKTVLYAIAQGKALEELTQEEYHELCPHIGPDVYEHISIERCVSARRELGGPAPESVQHSIAVLRQSLAKS
jgi:argininosuccinate lyase